MHLTESIRQVWPAFLLVCGLLLIGLAASADGLFLRAGALLERLPGPPAVLLAAGMLLTTCITAVLNLDTAVVFLTPVLIAAARRRGTSLEPFIFSAIFIANASSLYLPGSNLTNLLVLGRDPISGGAFASQMILPALIATLATAAGVLALFHRQLHRSHRRPAAEPLPAGSHVGLAGALLAACLTLALSRPALIALSILGLGLACTAVQIARRRLQPAEVISTLGPLVLIALFCLTVGLGLLARSWAGPAHLLSGAGRWGTAGIGALASVALNNLPAAVLLSSRPLAHPRALLLGLNLGPNLAVSDSLSSYLWLKAAAQVGQRPSLLTFSKLGILLSPVAILGALLAVSLSGAPT